MNTENKIVGIGYNGMPRGCNDNLLPWGKMSTNKLENKYMYGKCIVCKDVVKMFQKSVHPIGKCLYCMRSSTEAVKVCGNIVECLVELSALDKQELHLCILHYACI